MRGGGWRNSVRDRLKPSGSRVDDAQSNRRTVTANQRYAAGEGQDDVGGGRSCGTPQPPR
jgi:hypothetical protein